MGNTYGSQPKQDEEESAEESNRSDSRQQTFTGGGGSAEVDYGLKFGDVVQNRDDSSSEDLVVVTLLDAIVSEWAYSAQEKLSLRETIIIRQTMTTSLSSSEMKLMTTCRVGPIGMRRYQSPGSKTTR